ncbi:TPA: hypothetical protein DDW35_02335, partial [Candidatus Sumerlaeota bacterium]|nr:hypothetical protein [Candidatus Sumerlaeota bacterium]
MVFLSEESLPRRTGVGLGTGWLGRLTLCLALFAALTVSAVQAQTITTPTLGKGTSEEPYQINKLGHLAWLSAQAALTTNTACYKMTANIDASATANWNVDVIATPALKHGFTPIGNTATPFLGTF